MRACKNAGIIQRAVAFGLYRKPRHYIQQDIGPGDEIGIVCMFIWAVTDSSTTGHEDHSGRAEPRDHLRVVSRARGHAAALEPASVSSTFNETYEFTIKCDRLKANDLLGADLHIFPLRKLFQELREMFFGGAQALLVGITQIHTEDRLRGNDVDGIGVKSDGAHGSD